MKFAQPEPEIAEDEVSESVGNVPPRLQIAVAVLSLAALIFAGLYWQRERSWQDLQQQNASLQQMYAEQQAFGDETELQVQKQLRDYQQSLGTAHAVTLNTIEWAANQSSAYDFRPIAAGRFSLISY